ncbi:hypothetical protein [Marinicrinis sediminis]|uniref:Uncharacterized protein n=1 Tax=Marinicrinis sediminis TaxID=1652465 RepID=A0ABW5RDW9_9BACL
MKRVTVRFHFVETDGSSENLDYDGYLTSNNAAIFVDDIGAAVVHVRLLEDDVYLMTSHFTYVRLGTASIEDVPLLYKRLKRMSAYELVIEHVIKLAIDEVAFDL